MNYIVIFKKGGDLKSSFFYEYEGPIISISNIDDVIDFMRLHACPDKDEFLIKETLLNSDVLTDSKIITELYNLYNKLF